MNKQFFLTLFSFSILVLFAGCDEEQAYIQKAAREDLDFMYEQIKTNHPGPIATDDPLFKQRMEEIYKNCLAHVGTVKTRSDYTQLIRSFTAYFNDHHLRVILKSDRPEKRKKGDFESFSFDEIAPRIGWLRLPTFDPNREQQKQLDEMISMMTHLRGYRAVVFDIHGNKGGNNEWGRKIISEFFTPAYADYKRRESWKKISVEYRVSKDNLDYIRNRSEKFAREFGKDDPLSVGYRNFYNLMKEAADKGEASILVPKGLEEQMAKVPRNPVRPLILVIVDGRCAGAALDFIDELKTLGHPVILFGQQTSADTFYMDERDVMLPSRFGNFIFPIKIYRGRLRGNNQPYYPEAPYDGDLGDVRQVAEAVYQYITKLGVRN